MFRRRQADEVDDDLADDERAAADEVEERSRTVLPPQPTTGPWDVTDLPKGDDTNRVDLGGLAIPLLEGIDLQLQVENDVVGAVLLVDGASQLVVNAFAAPKTAGLWADVRAEIADSLNTSGGSAEETQGGFGVELRARIPDGTGGSHAARFLGIDGPRWFLRGLVSGPAATDTQQAGRLEDVFRGIVVVRGTDAMAPRDALAIHLPREAIEQMAAGEPEERVLEFTERGPEITEIQ